jgi:hypothetical protein
LYVIQISSVTVQTQNQKEMGIRCRWWGENLDFHSVFSTAIGVAVKNQNQNEIKVELRMVLKNGVGRMPFD